jgi:CBS domain-containing protein
MGTRMPTAKDLMTKNAICVKKDTSLLETMELMLKNNIAGVPVVEDDMTLSGIITEKDVLKLIYEREKIENSVASDYMTYPVICFEENETLLDICDCLMTHDFRRVPVTSNGKVIGIISRPDIIQHILKSIKVSKDV